MSGILEEILQKIDFQCGEQQHNETFMFYYQGITKLMNQVSFLKIQHETYKLNI